MVAQVMSQLHLLSVEQCLLVYLLLGYETSLCLVFYKLEVEHSDKRVFVFGHIISHFVFRVAQLLDNR